MWMKELQYELHGSLEVHNLRGGGVTEKYGEESRLRCVGMIKQKNLKKVKRVVE